VRLLAGGLLARRLPAGDGAALRVGIVPAPYRDGDPGVAAACRAALTIAGWTMREVELPGAVHAAAFMLGGSPSWAPRSRPRCWPMPARRCGHSHCIPRLWPAARLARADRVRALLRRGLADAFAGAGLSASGVGMYHGGTEFAPSH
jgi:hypothetical protein